MRNKSKVLNELLTFVSEENRIRAILVNESRLNINTPKDLT